MMLNLPNLESAFNGKTQEQILDALHKYRKELNFLLMNLDESNMPSIAGRLDGLDGSFSLIDQQLDSITLAVGNAQGDISALQLRADGIDLSVSSLDGDLSALQITVGGIQSTVSSHTTTIGTHTSQITQLGNAISSVVSFTDVTGNQIASKINQTATTITIAASKIDLKGITTLWATDGSNYRIVSTGYGIRFYRTLTGIYGYIENDAIAGMQIRGNPSLYLDDSVIVRGYMDFENMPAYEYNGSYWDMVTCGGGRSNGGGININYSSYGITIQRVGTSSSITIPWD